MTKFKYTPNVKRLSLTSFFTDFASEMLYPIMPLLWSSLGFSAQAIGVIEGLAEAVAGLSKLLWGYIADKFRNYKTLVVIGYATSAVMKPLLGVTTTYIVPLAARNIERLGKAIRTAPRDAILAHEAKAADRPRVFGFHRSMDTLGAVVGPAICLVLLLIFKDNLRAIFLLAAIPGALAVAAAWAIDDRGMKQVKVPPKTPLSKAIIRQLLRLKHYKRLLLGIALFALVNSSDAFLILRLRDLGFSNELIVFAYIFYNAIYAILAKSTHRLTTKLGLQKTLALSIALFSIVYGLLSLDLSYMYVFITLMVYGMFAGSYEVTHKAWLVNISPHDHKGTAVGLAGTVTSFGFLVSSLFTGWLWSTFGSADTLALLAVFSLLPLAYFLTVSIGEHHAKA